MLGKAMIYSTIVLSETCLFFCYNLPSMCPVSRFGRYLVYSLIPMSIKLKDTNNSLKVAKFEKQLYAYLVQQIFIFIQYIGTIAQHENLVTNENTVVTTNEVNHNHYDYPNQLLP